MGVVDELAEPLDQGLAQRVVLPGICVGKLRGFLAQSVEVEIGGLSECGLVHGDRRYESSTWARLQLASKQRFQPVKGLQRLLGGHGVGRHA